MKRVFRISLIACLILSFGLLNSKVKAEISNLSETCESVEKIDNECKTISQQECKEFLKKCASYLEEKSSQIEKDIDKTEKEKKSLTNEISVLKKKIQNLDYQIYEGNVMIKDLTLQIQDTQFSIDKISSKIGDSRVQLADILRMVREEDEKSLIEIFLEGNLSDFFDNLIYLENLNLKLQELLESTKDLKSYLEGQSQQMDKEKEDMEKVIKIQSLQKQDQEKTKKEQEYFLKLTEAEYQKYLAEKTETEKKSAAIRSRIFELLGVPKAPTFGEAYEIAKYVSEITGIRSALLLAVLTQESNIGTNVGQCYLKNTQTGDGVYIKTGAKAPKTMNPDRDIPYFLEIIKQLNTSRNLARDPFETPVSCTMYYQGKPYGWGGAMGPGQFMPSTWSKSGYGNKVQNITGKTADPWDIRDAFLATALYLKDLGGTKNEFKAVMSYFSGASWASWESFYGNSVLKIATNYEEDIKEIEKGS